VLGDERIEQRLIVVLQVAHIGIFSECGVPAVEHPLAALTLVLERADVRRQQPVQREASRSASLNAVPLLRRGFMSRPSP